MQVLYWQIFRSARSSSRVIVNIGILVFKRIKLGQR